jgi:cytochrome c oxidase cbb3-type subunit 3
MTRLAGLFGSIVVIGVIATLSAASDAAAQPARRGEQVFGQQCAVCHGADARGGAHGGADLLQSPIVLDDERGVGLGKFLAVGRPAKQMPAFKLPRQQVADIAAFLHARIAAAASSRFTVETLVGDAKAGEAYFNGSGGCTACHAVTGDLAHIGKKYDAVTLQGRMIVPRGRGGYPAARTTATARYGRPSRSRLARR